MLTVTGTFAGGAPEEPDEIEADEPPPLHPIGKRAADKARTKCANL
jgi:hypothetical protein